MNELPDAFQCLLWSYRSAIKKNKSGKEENFPYSFSTFFFYFFFYVFILYGAPVTP